MARHVGQGAERTKRRAFWTFVMWLAIAVFVVSVGYLAMIAYSYWSDQNRYTDIADTSFDPGEATGDGGLADMAVDWDALRAINPEVVAWVYVPGTVISYPVCQCGDNQKYLDLNFDGAKGVWTGCGTIFLDCTDRPDFSCENNVLYGHHMNDGSMFACLSDFADSAVFEQHRDVYLLTPTQNMRFRSFSLVRTVGSDTLVEVDFPTAEEKAAYVADKESRSMVQPVEGFVPPRNVTKILTLSTCDYNEADGRAVLFCSLEEAEEPVQGGANVVGTAEGFATG